MIDKIKMFAAAIAIAMLPMMASAVPVTLIEGGASNAINLNNEYGYAELVSGNTSETRIFQLNATPPSQVALGAEFATLEFTGLFQNLVIKVATNMGDVFATLASTAGNVKFFQLNTVFNNDNGFSQSLEISWSGVANAAGQDALASFNIQALPSQVPVPAAGFLLLGALAGFGALRRRKKA